MGATQRAAQAQATGAAAAQATITATQQTAQAKLQAVQAELRQAQAAEASARAAATGANAALQYARAVSTATQADIEAARANAQTARLVATVATARTQAARAAVLQAEATATAGQSAGQARAQFGNLAQQIQDVAVQASSGTDALIILAQQGPQIAGAFGGAGAAIGAVIAVAAAAGLAFGVMGSESARAVKVTEDQDDRLNRLAKTLRLVRDDADGLAAGFAALNQEQQGTFGANVEAQVANTERQLSARLSEQEDFFRIFSEQSVKFGQATPAQSKELNQAFIEFRPDQEGSITRLVEATEELARASGLGQLQVRELGLRAVELATNVTEAEVAANDARVEFDALDGTLEQGNQSWKDYREGVVNAARALQSAEQTIERLRARREALVAAGSDPRERFVQEQLSAQKLSDIADPGKRTEKEQTIRQEAGQLFAEQERIRVEEKRTDVASRLRIQEQELTGAVDARVRAGERAYAQTLAQTEGDRALADQARQVALREHDRSEAIQQANQAASQAQSLAERRGQFATGLDQEQEQLVALKGAIDQGSDAYERQKNVLEVMRRVRSAGYDLTTAEGKAALARAGQLRDETEALDRQASVRKDLDNIIKRSTEAVGITATGERLDLGELTGLTPQAIEEVVARAEFVRSVIEKLGNQKPEIIAQEAAKANDAFSQQQGQDVGVNAAARNAELQQEEERQATLRGAILLTAQARQEVTDRIEAENRTLQILKTTEGEEARAMIEREMGLARTARATELVTQLNEEYATGAEYLRDRLLELKAAEDTGKLTPEAAAGERRRAIGVARRKEIERLEGTEDPIAGAQAGLLRLQEQVGTTAGMISGVLVDSVNSGVDAFVDLAASGELSFENLGESLSKIGQDVAATVAKFLIMRAILASFGGMGVTPAAGGPQSLFPVQHQGGIVGEGGAMRRVDPMVFASAPRYHTGGMVLGRDEVPIIAQRGERVLSKQEVASSRSAEIKFEVIDQRGANAPPVETERGRDSNGREFIRAIIRSELDQAITSGATDRSQRSRFGTRPVLR
jgi:hypothetical protein